MADAAKRIPPHRIHPGLVEFWFDDGQRLNVAKAFQLARVDYIRKVWSKDRELHAENIFADDSAIAAALDNYAGNVDSAEKTGDLLQREALLTKQLYRYAAKATQYADFSRDHDGTDLANGFLNHGSYLAYGLAATTLWVLGIPHGFAVMHGKTRRGALVFDVADLIKDAIVLPWAFVCAKEKMSEQEFRQQILQKFTDHKALDFMFEQVKQQAIQSPLPEGDNCMEAGGRTAPGAVVECRGEEEVKPQNIDKTVGSQP